MTKSKEYQNADAFKRLLMREIAAGLKQAREAGVKFGRPKKMVKISEIRYKLAQGIPKSKICKEYGIGRSTLYKKLEEDKEIV